MENFEFYRKLNNLTLFPFEKLKTQTQYASKEKNKDSHYLSLLKESICKNKSDEAIKKYCALNDFSQNDLGILVSKSIHTTEEVHLPNWINTIEQTSKYFNQQTVSFSENTYKIPFYQLLSPFVEFCYFEFKKNLETVGIEAPIYNVSICLKNTLHKELSILSETVFLEEFLNFLKETKKDQSLNTDEEDYYYKRFVEKNLKDQLKSIFAKYPVLSRLIATKVNQYTFFITQLFKRFYKDKSEIETSFKTKLGDVQKIHINVGDQHNGQTTSILEFKNEFKIVYKPINLSITFAYNKLLDWINKGLNENLKSFKIIDKSRYGWIEFVKTSDCKTTEEVKTYYKRAGILAGVAYFLNSRDFHSENVIASGDCPVLIDHEMILGPEIKSSLLDEKSKTDKTILESMLLPAYEEDSIKRCGFGSIKQLKDDITVFPKLINYNKDTMKKVPQIGTYKNNSNNIPKKNKELQFLENYQSNFIEGLKEVYNLILNNKELLVSKASPLQHFEKKKIRYIFRATEIYSKLLFMLIESKYLKDATAYGLKLEMLSRIYQIYDDMSIDILESERQQIMDRDTPVFYASSNNDYITLPNGKTANLFEKSAVASIKENIKNASLEDLKCQISLINEVLS